MRCYSRSDCDRDRAIRLVWGSRERNCRSNALQAVVIAELLFAKYRFYAAGAAALAIGALWLFIEKTPYGAMIKAGSYDSEMIRALGINLTRLRMGVFALGVALAAFAGVVLARSGNPAAGRRRCGRAAF
jgi:branched-chain amino acid transport system permease protein